MTMRFIIIGMTIGIWVYILNPSIPTYFTTTHAKQVAEMLLYLNPDISGYDIKYKIEDEILATTVNSRLTGEFIKFTVKYNLSEDNLKFANGNPTAIAVHESLHKRIYPTITHTNQISSEDEEAVVWLLTARICNIYRNDRYNSLLNFNIENSGKSFDYIDDLSFDIYQKIMLDTIFHEKMKKIRSDSNHN